MKARYIYSALFALAICCGFTACSEDDVDKNISVIVDSQTPQNDLDRWLEKNYVQRYNIELRYRWEDNEIDMNYILVPAKYEHAVRMARILKYICFDSFDEVTGGPEFIRASFPKVVQLVGNPGWNGNGSYTLGSSEGGYKINLWYVNHLGDNIVQYDSSWQLIKNDSVIRDREELNATYFHTIIHEYGHSECPTPTSSTRSPVPTIWAVPTPRCSPAPTTRRSSSAASSRPMLPTLPMRTSPRPSLPTSPAPTRS